MKNVSIRIEDDLMSMLSEISVRPTVSVQTAIEVLLYLRRATLHELKGKFCREEISALVDSFEGLVPTWRIMCNPLVLATQTEDAEKYRHSASSNGADPLALIEKIKQLTSAQASILQLELWAFWNRDDATPPDMELLIKSLS